MVEFTYNKNYQESLRTSPFEALYGQSCSTPISWSDLVSRALIGPEMLADMEQEMQVIKKNLKVAHDRQKSYADRNRLFKKFQLGNRCTYASNQRRAPYEFDHVLSWHHDFVDPSISLRGLV